jgi:hypothetical protein
MDRNNTKGQPAKSVFRRDRYKSDKPKFFRMAAALTMVHFVSLLGTVYAVDCNKVTLKHPVPDHDTSAKALIVQQGGGNVVLSEANGNLKFIINPAFYPGPCPTLTTDWNWRYRGSVSGVTSSCSFSKRCSYITFTGAGTIYTP